MLHVIKRRIADVKDSYSFVVADLDHTSFRSKGSFIDFLMVLEAYLFPCQPSFEIGDFPSSFVDIALWSSVAFLASSFQEANQAAFLKIESLADKDKNLAAFNFHTTTDKPFHSSTEKLLLDRSNKTEKMNAFAFQELLLPRKTQCLEFKFQTDPYCPQPQNAL